MIRLGLVASGVAALALVGAGPARAANAVFTNHAAIAVPDRSKDATATQGQAGLYPSPITVSGLCATVQDIYVPVNSISHTAPDDIDMLLVGPHGEKSILMSDTGGQTDVNNLTLTFDDFGIGTFTDNGAITQSNYYKPADFDGGDGDAFPSPAPPGPYGASLAPFRGIDPNGVWKLYVQDDAPNDVGQIAGGWDLILTPKPAPCPPAETDAPLAPSSTAKPPPGGTSDVTRPALTGISFSRSVFAAARSGASTARKHNAKVGTKVSFALSEASSVKFTVQRKARGRRVQGSCRPAIHANRKKPRCTRWKAVRGSFTIAGKAGKNSFTFRGRVGGRSLAPGGYRLSGSATDPSRNTSLPRRKGFAIVR
jgi:subtilisin-like proprotein convertase family protein